MSLKTDNFKLFKYEDNDTADLRFINDSMDIIDKGINPFYVATQSSTNVYKVTTGLNKTVLNDGYSIKVAIPSNSTGAVSITVDSVTVPVKKPNGNAVTNFKANGVYSLTYYNSVFILASGGVDDVNFSASDLLIGKSANDSNGEKVNGTMPNKGTVTHSLSANGSLTLPSGYYDSIKITQSLNTRGATVWKPSTSAQSIPSGTYLTGTQTIQGDTNLAPQNIRAGVSIFGIAGSADVYNLGGIKYNIGSVVCKSSSEPFSKEGATPSTQPIAEITGLSFRPKYGFVFRYDTEMINIGLFDNYNFYLKNGNSEFVFSLTDYNNGTYLIGSNFIRFPLVANNELGREYKYFIFG